VADVLFCPLCGRRMRLVERRDQPHEEAWGREEIWECPEHGRMRWREYPYHWKLTNDMPALYSLPRH